MIANAHDRPRIAVIGAGPGGLAAGVLLAARGLPVTIYEAQPTIGGRTSQVRAGGFRFDLGPTFFLMPHVLQEVFAAAGRNLADFVELTRLDPMYRLVIGQDDGEDLTLDTTQDLAEMQRRIAAICPADGEAFGRFIDDNRRKLLASEPILRRSIRSPWDLVRLDALKAARHIQPTRTVQALNQRYFQHPAVQLAVGFQSKYLGMSPYDCPSLFTILPFIEYEYGVWHPRGGCHALMQALADVFLELGGEIQTETPVERLTFEQDRVTGVELPGRGAGRVEPCDHAVINADATWALKKFFPASRRGADSDARIDARKYSCSTFMLYLGVEGKVDLPHHTIRIAPNYRQNLEDIGRNHGHSGTLTDDPSFYVCNPSVTDPGLAPDGHSALYVLLPTPNTTSGIDWHAETPMLRARLLSHMRDVLKIDLAGRIREEVVFTPDDWAGLNINHGATFNLAHSLDQMLHRRPHHEVPYARGAWLVGGGTHPGSGLPVIFLSAQITTDLILRRIQASQNFERPDATARVPVG